MEVWITLPHARLRPKTLTRPADPSITGTIMDTSHDARWEAVTEALELLHDEQVDEAIPMLRAVLERDPGNPYAHFYLGTALASQGRLGPALVAFTEARRHAPAYLGAVVAAGWCLHELGRFAEAVKMGEQALEIHPDDGDALHLLALSHAELGATHAAAKYLERYLEGNLTVEARFEAEALLQALRGKAIPIDDLR